MATKGIRENLMTQLEQKFDTECLDMIISTVTEVSGETAIHPDYFASAAVNYECGDSPGQLSKEELTNYFVDQMREDNRQEIRAKGYLWSAGWNSLTDARIFTTEKFTYIVPNSLVEMYDIKTATQAKEKLQYIEIATTPFGETIRVSIAERLPRDHPDNHGDDLYNAVELDLHVFGSVIDPDRRQIQVFCGDRQNALHAGYRDGNTEAKSDLGSPYEVPDVQMEPPQKRSDTRS